MATADYQQKVNVCRSVGVKDIRQLRCNKIVRIYDKSSAFATYNATNTYHVYGRSRTACLFVFPCFLLFIYICCVKPYFH